MNCPHCAARYSTEWELEAHVKEHYPASPDAKPDPLAFSAMWRAFMAENPQVAGLSRDERAMLKRGFIYGWRAREIADHPR